jgi:threonine dehydratase
MSSASRAVSLETIRDAGAHIYDLVVRTPLVRLDVPAAWRTRWPNAPRALYLKLETLQPVGSFKIRGAHNTIRQLPAAERTQGVWTVSAGNAAQGVALAARQAGLSCTVLIPDTAPAAKRVAIARFGATMVVTTFERCWEAVEHRRAEGIEGTLVHPFDDDRFISGNGTIGLEIVEDRPDVDAVVVAVGGGGLLGGISCAMKALRPDARRFAAEPETAAPLAASLAAGAPARFPAWQPSFVDGAGGRSVLPSMWPLLRDLDGSIVVPLADVQAAMRLVAEQVHVIMEGAGATAVAAALTGRAGTGTVVAVVSGGNIDLSRFATLVEDGQAHPEPAADEAALTRRALQDAR